MLFQTLATRWCQAFQYLNMTRQSVHENKRQAYGRILVILVILVRLELGDLRLLML